MQPNNICELDRCDLMRIKKTSNRQNNMLRNDANDTLGGLIGRQHVIYDLK